MEGYDMHKTQMRLALAIILTHAGVNIAHGAAHIAEEIWLPPAANAFVGLVILLAPFLALGLLYTRRQRAGAWLLFASMLSALLFGVAYHLLLPGPDNIAQVADESWGITFQASALLLAALEASGVVVGAWMLHTLHHSK
jgi:hypothetical protein